MRKVITYRSLLAADCMPGHLWADHWADQRRCYLSVYGEACYGDIIVRKGNDPCHTKPVTNGHYTGSEINTLRFIQR